MWSKPFVLLALAGLVLTAGCGYHLSARMPYALPQDISTVFLARVNNPSTNSWLEPKLRTEFRDELTKRGGIQWVAGHEAEGKLELDIQSFQSGTKLEDSQEKNVRSEMVLTLEAKLFSSRDDSLLARTGSIVVSESFDPQSPADENAAQDRVVELASELAVERLNQVF